MPTAGEWLVLGEALSSANPLKWARAGTCSALDTAASAGACGAWDGQWGTGVARGTEASGDRQQGVQGP